MILIRNLVNEFSSFARFPSANPKPCELPTIIEETIALYKEGHKNITFETSVQDKFPLLNLDRQQIKQAMINLLDNAIAAIKNEGKIFISLAHDPILNMVRLEIADNGAGISDISGDLYLLVDTILNIDFFFVSTENVLAFNDPVIYPNPASEVLNIELGNSIGKANIRIIDISF